jgi:hypothetical protein
VHVLVVREDRLGDLLEQRRLAGLGRADDQGALPAPDRAEQVDQPARDRAPRVLERETRLGVDAGQVLERLALANASGSMPSIRMKILKGIPVSPGIVIGRVRVLDDAKGRRIPKRVIEQARPRRRSPASTPPATPRSPS